VHIVKRSFDKEKIVSKFNSTTFADTYYAISIRNLQTTLYRLMLGYVLASASFFG